MRLITLICLFALSNLLSVADEIRLSYMEIKELKPLHYSMLLKLPTQNNAKLSVSMVMPNECTLDSPKRTQHLNKTYIDTWNIVCSSGLESKTLHIQDLRETNTELLLRIELLSKVSHSVLLSPTKSSYSVPTEHSLFQVITTYVWLGITHILVGVDHLLFIFTLLLIVKSIRRLIITITAFTIAHSLTMAAATFGIVTIPQAPVEAIIALSIVFLAMEIIHEKQGKRGLTSLHPWIIAFLFGLLHGFGFAGALLEIGLPQHSIPLALIFFNLGVEVGQLIFVAIIIITISLLKEFIQEKLLNKIQTGVVYFIGGIATYWFIERTLSF